jgi:hypothetical protein
MGFQHPELVAVMFDQKGGFIKFEAHPISDEAKAALGNGSTAIGDDLRRIIDPEFLAWQQTIGFRPGPIKVVKFFLPECYIGIQDLPQHYQEFLENPEFVTDSQEREEWYSDIKNWRDNGSFVFCWGDDLWMDKNGEVSSS